MYLCVVYLFGVVSFKPSSLHATELSFFFPALPPMFTNRQSGQTLNESREGYIAIFEKYKSK